MTRPLRIRPRTCPTPTKRAYPRPAHHAHHRGDPMTPDALRRLQALRPTRTGSIPAVLAAVQGDLQAVIEAVLELADREHDCPCGRNAPATAPESAQEARSADSGTGAPPEPESAAQGRIGWLRLRPDDDYRNLAREVPDGWTDDDEDDLAWSAEHLPDAEFTPIRTLADDEVAVKREDLRTVLRVTEIFDAFGGPSPAATRLRAALDGDA